MSYCGFNIQPFCSDVCGDHRRPQTLAEICRTMGICCGFRAVGARVKISGAHVIVSRFFLSIVSSVQIYINGIFIQMIRVNTLKSGHKMVDIWHITFKIIFIVLDPNWIIMCLDQNSRRLMVMIPLIPSQHFHYSDVIIGVKASQITSRLFTQPFNQA